MVAIWTLTDAAGRVATCTLIERDDGWHLLVREGVTVLIAERCRSVDAAWVRASEIAAELSDLGWRERRH